MHGVCLGFFSPWALQRCPGTGSGLIILGACRHRAEQHAGILLPTKACLQLGESCLAISCTVSNEIK